jgi:hypothetical protein
MEFINIDRENGALIMRYMETALGFPGRDLLGALYDERWRHIRAFYSCDEDANNVHRYTFKMRADGKLAAYSHRAMPVKIFIQHLGQMSGFTLTVHQDRIIKVFGRIMTPELALVETGINPERTSRRLPAVDFSGNSPDNPGIK